MPPKSKLITDDKPGPSRSDTSSGSKPKPSNPPSDTSSGSESSRSEKRRREPSGRNRDKLFEDMDKQVEAGASLTDLIEYYCDHRNLTQDQCIHILTIFQDELKTNDKSPELSQKSVASLSEKVQEMHNDAIKKESESESDIEKLDSESASENKLAVSSSDFYEDIVKTPVPKLSRGQKFRRILRKVRRLPCQKSADEKVLDYVKMASKELEAQRRAERGEVVSRAEAGSFLCTVTGLFMGRICTGGSSPIVSFVESSSSSPAISTPRNSTPEIPDSGISLPSTIQREGSESTSQATSQQEESLPEESQRVATPVNVEIEEREPLENEDPEMLVKQNLIDSLLLAISTCIQKKDRRFLNRFIEILEENEDTPEEEPPSKRKEKSMVIAKNIPAKSKSADSLCSIDDLNLDSPKEIKSRMCVMNIDSPNVAVDMGTTQQSPDISINISVKSDASSTEEDDEMNADVPE